MSTSGQDASPARVALVVGGGAPRIGHHVALALAARGYRVAIHYFRSSAAAEASAAAIAAQGGQAIAVQADIRHDDQVRRMVEQVVSRFGRIDALVNCAAIWEKKPLEATTGDDLRRHFEINTLGTFLCAREAGLCMVRQSEGGAIVNFGDWAIVRPYLDYAAYFPSKGAIPALTRSLAVELARRNPRVRVNAILPGPVMLPEDMTAEERATIAAQTLVQREGTPQHAVAGVLFLLDNDFITGVCLPIDGGRSIFSP